MQINPKDLYVRIYCEKCGYVAMGAKKVYMGLPGTLFNWTCRTPDCKGPLTIGVALEIPKEEDRADVSILKRGPNGTWIFKPVGERIDRYRYGRNYQAIDPSDLA